MYGISIAGAMLNTSVLFVLALIHAWNIPYWRVVPYIVVFWTTDLIFFAASLQKVPTYGWISLLAALILFSTMYSFRDTSLLLKAHLEDKLLTMVELRYFVKLLNRSAGTIIFVSNGDEDVPHVLNVCATKLNSLPQTIVCLSAVCMPTPFIADEERYIFRTIDPNAGIYRLVISYGMFCVFSFYQRFPEKYIKIYLIAFSWTGYAERSIDTVAAIEKSKKRGLRIAPEETVVFVIGREMIKAGHHTKWWHRFSVNFYDLISRNTESKIDYFNLPANDTLEVNLLVVILII
ncbi:hypothetical protein HK098_006924 [Nowakowskiella sp. JEL0407]|nr:hypothetical protein HK098_006924 [Nowakowskiella sp. JEL0407]